MFYKKGVLKNFVKFTEKHLCQSLFLNVVAGLRLENTYDRVSFLIKLQASGFHLPTNFLLIASLIALPK